MCFKSDSALSPLKGGSGARRKIPYVYWVPRGVPSNHLPLCLTVAQTKNRVQQTSQLVRPRTRFRIGLKERDSEFAHRIAVLEDLQAEVSDMRREFGILKAGVQSMAEAFSSLKVAIYASAGTILSAAVIVVIMGRAA